MAHATTCNPLSSPFHSLVYECTEWAAATLLPDLPCPLVSLSVNDLNVARAFCILKLQNISIEQSNDESFFDMQVVNLSSIPSR